MTDWQVIEYEQISYQDGLNIQEKYWQLVVKGDKHTLILLQHNPVITMGRRTEASDILINENELRRKGIELFRVDRGGSATYHGPGQLVGYIFVKASRYGGIHTLVKKILNVLQEIISSFGIKCVADFDNPGIWTDSDNPRKLAAIGMQNKKGYTKHGFAINVNIPLTNYNTIKPCGLDLPVSTMSIELGNKVSLDEVQKRVKEYLPAKLYQKKSIGAH